MEYEDRLTISTPEGVELDLTLAGIGSRFSAGAIDFAIQTALIVASIALFAQLGEAEVSGAGVQGDGDSLALGAALVSLWTFVVIFTYDVLFEVRGGGRTPGKRLTGLRVVRTEGQPVGFVTSAIRNVVRIVDAVPPLYGIGIVSVFVTRRNQRLGDIAAGTVVIRERTGGRRSPPVPPTRESAAARAAEWDVSGVSADDAATVRRFLERRAELDPAARSGLADDLSRRLRPQVAGAPDELGAEPFLEALADAKAARAG